MRTFCLVSALFLFTTPAHAGSSVNRDTSSRGGVYLQDAYHPRASDGRLTIKKMDALEKRWSKLLEAIIEVEKDNGYNGDDFDHQTDKKRGIMGANTEHWLAFREISEDITSLDFAHASKDSILSRYIVVGFWYKNKLDSDKNRVLTYHYGIKEQAKIKTDPDKYWDRVKKEMK